MTIAVNIVAALCCYGLYIAIPRIVAAVVAALSRPPSGQRFGSTAGVDMENAAPCAKGDDRSTQPPTGPVEKFSLAQPPRPTPAYKRCGSPPPPSWLPPVAAVSLSVDPRSLCPSLCPSSGTMATLQTNFPPLKNDLILRVSRGEQVERTPVWIMRQAGRYLPEFRAVKVEHDFFAVCQDPELACKVTLQPIDRYPGLLDASIIFSDILVIPQALGLEVIMVPGKGPHFPNPIVTPADLVRVDANVNVHEKLKYVYDAITLTRTRLDGRVPLFGFVGAPWTLMAYSIEGGGSKTLSKAKSWLYVHPEESHRFMQIITDAIVPFLVGQVKAGAQMLQVFDSWAGELSPSTFKTFSLPYLAQIATRVKAQLREEGIEPVPMTVFAKGAHFALAELSELEYEVVSLDWTIDIEKAQRETQGKVVLQGNADPCVLYGDRETIRAQVKEMIEAFGKGGKHVANLGHGIYPDMDPEHLRNFLEAVRDFSTVAE